MSTLLMWSSRLRGYSMIPSSEKNLQNTCLSTNATKQARAMENRMGHNKDWSHYTSFSTLRALASMNLSLHFHALSTAPIKSYHFCVNPPQAPCLSLWQNTIARFSHFCQSIDIHVPIPQRTNIPSKYRFLSCANVFSSHYTWIAKPQISVPFLSASKTS